VIERGIHKVRQANSVTLYIRRVPKDMKRIWIALAFALIVAAITWAPTGKQSQAVAKYISMCFIIAIVIRPVGLTIGATIRRLTAYSRRRTDEGETQKEERGESR
jgi:hypothetical protein